MHLRTEGYRAVHGIVREEGIFMITIKSTAYTKEDVIFTINVLSEGLCNLCVNKAVGIVNKDLECVECHHRIACSDLQSAYYYMLAKLTRMDAQEHLDEIIERANGIAR